MLAGEVIEIQSKRCYSFLTGRRVCAFVSFVSFCWERVIAISLWRLPSR